MKIRTSMIAALAAGIAATTMSAGPAQAAPVTTVVYSSSSYLPAVFAVSHGKVAFLACTTVYEVKTEGSTGPLPSPGCSGHVETPAGLAYSRDGHTQAHTSTTRIPVTQNQSVSSYVGTKTDAVPPVYRGAAVSTLEWTRNPDGEATYGTTSSSSCVRDALGADASYRGRLDSNLPAVAAGADDWSVADRDGNTIYRFDSSGTLSVLAVLPPVKVKVSTGLAASLGWPSCVVGTKVAFEAAPTEIEVGPDGSVYAAGLPTLQSGRQADRSVIFKINPTTGKIERLSQRYPGRVDLAVGTRGRLFVARPDAGKISVIKRGRSSTYVKLPDVVSVETDENGQLYAVRGTGSSLELHDAELVRIG